MENIFIVLVVNILFLILVNGVFNKCKCSYKKYPVLVLTIGVIVKTSIERETFSYYIKKKIQFIKFLKT